MKYVDIINKHRREEETFTKAERNVSCWAAFQTIHINKKGELKICPFIARSEREYEDTTPFELDKNKYRARWEPGKSLRDIWQNDIGFEEVRDASLSGDLHDWCRYCKEQCDKDKPPSSLDFDWVGGDRDLNHAVPKEIELELSNTCNYKCKFCSPYHSSQHMLDMGKNMPRLLKEQVQSTLGRKIPEGLEFPEYKAFMDDINPHIMGRFESIYDDPEVADAFIESLRDIIHEVDKLNFTGGEPFAQAIVHKIIKMVEEENPKNLKIQITTNGSILNGYARKLAQRPNTTFTVSLDSIDPEIYKDLRRRGDLNKVLKHIEELQAYGIANVGCSFVVSKDNVYTLPDILSFCNSKLLTFSYHILSPMGGTSTPKDIEPWAVEAETKEYLSDLREFLLNADITPCEDKNIGRRNARMYHQYIERLK